MKKIVLIIAIFVCLPGMSEAGDFFPIGMFSVGPENLETVKNAGFNTAHTYITDPELLRKYIDSAGKMGIKLLIYPADRADKGAMDREKAARFIGKYKQSSAILAWYLADEPDLSGGSPSQLEAIHAFIRTLDPSRPTAIVIHRSDRYGQYKEASDVLMIDRYPVPKTPLNHIAETTRWAGVQKEGRGPVWAVLQAFGYQNPQLKGWGVREPTYDEMRAMTFLSVIYGAKGIFYYAFAGSQYRMLESPAHWNDLKKIVRELNGIYPLLLAGGELRNVKVEIIEGPQKDERGLLPVHLSEINLGKDSGGYKAGKYFIAANASDSVVKARFSVASSSQGQEGKVEVLGSKRDVVFKEESFVDIFRPYDVHIYRNVNTGEAR